MISIFDLVIGIIFIFLLYRYYLIRKLYKDETESNLSGCEVGNKILDNNKLDNIYIVKTSNPFEEGYESGRKVIRLSKDVFDGESLIYNILVAKECSYSILDKRNDKLFKVRNLFSKVINILIYLCYICIIVCSILKNLYLLRISIIILTIIIMYHFIFINLENKCNSLSIKQLKKINIINDDNIDKVNDIMNSLKYSYITNPINLVHKIIIYLFKK